MFIKQGHELAVGNTDGDLAIFKGSSKSPWKRCSSLGMVCYQCAFTKRFFHYKSTSYHNCNVISLTTLCYNAWYQHWLYLCCTSQFIKLSIIVWLPYMLLHHGNAFQFCFILVIVKNWILLSFCQYVHYILLKYINKIICHLWWKNVKSVSWIWFEYSFFFSR